MEQRYRTPWWKEARDCEALHGRAFAVSTWGTGYYRDDSPPPARQLTARVAALEKSVNRLYALSALRQVESQEAKAIPRKQEAAKTWKPSDGLAAREV